MPKYSPYENVLKWGNANVVAAAPGVWQLVLPWTRAYILTDGTVFTLADTGTCWDRRRLLAACAALGLDPVRCHSILLTHGHCDHAGNAAFFAARYGAKVYAHTDECPFLETRHTYIPCGWRAFGVQGAMFALGEIFYPVRRSTMDVVLADGDSVETPAGAWRVIYTPGHTPGHVCYFREDDGVLISGDALLTVIPFRRTEGLAMPPSIFNWDTPLVYRSVQRLAELAPRILLPGHGRPLHENTAARIGAFAVSASENTRRPWNDVY